MHSPHPHMAHAQALMARLGVGGDIAMDYIIDAFDKLPIGTNSAEGRLMRMFSNLTCAGLDRMRHFTITDGHGDPYLTRYFVEDYPDGSGIFLHRIHRSDADREMHDHPWNFRSFIVEGGYVEHTADGQRHTYTPGMWNETKADKVHRLELLARPTWTIVFHGPKIRDWGFVGEDGKWVHNETYLAQKFGDRPWAKVDDA